MQRSTHLGLRKGPMPAPATRQPRQQQRQPQQGAREGWAAAAPAAAARRLGSLVARAASGGGGGSSSRRQEGPPSTAAGASGRQSGPGPAATAEAQQQQQQQQQQAEGSHIDCVGTGMDVQCYVAADEPAASSSSAAPPGAAATSPVLGLTDADITPGKHLECVETGLGVSCFIADDEPGGTSAAAAGATADAAAAAPAAAAAAAAQPAAAAERPRTAAAAAASGDGGPLQQLLGVALLVSPFFFWGTSMVAMKPVTAHTTPLMLGAMRLLPAGLALVAWAAATGRPQPKTAAAWAWVLAFALVDGAAFQGFLAEGLQRTTAGLGSVIIDSQPLSVALLAAVLFGEALSGLGVAGLFIGVSGLLLLEVPQDVLAQAARGSLPGVAEGLRQAVEAATSGARVAGGGSWSLLDSGEFWMLLAAQSMAVGTIMVRWVTRHCDPVAATAWHMVLGGALLAGAAVAADGGSGELAARLGEFNAADAAAMAYVSLLGGAASYGIFFYEATHGSLTAISSLTFLTPVFAAGAGYLVLGETLTPVQLLGAAVTLASVFLINTPASHKPTQE